MQIIVILKISYPSIHIAPNFSVNSWDLDLIRPTAVKYCIKTLSILNSFTGYALNEQKRPGKQKTPQK